MENFSLINSHNLLKNLLLFPTEITNLLFVIKNRQSLKQNFMRNCKKTMDFIQIEAPDEKYFLMAK